MRLLQADDVVIIHDSVIEAHELQGLAQHKSIESIVARVENRYHYGLLQDVFELAACYGVYIAVGHAFNDANKRTGLAALDTCLVLNSIEARYDSVELGQKLIAAVVGEIDELDLAAWLRKRCG